MYKEALVSSSVSSFPWVEEKQWLSFVPEVLPGLMSEMSEFSNIMCASNNYACINGRLMWGSNKAAWGKHTAWCLVFSTGNGYVTKNFQFLLNVAYRGQCVVWGKSRWALGSLSCDQMTPLENHLIHLLPLWHGTLSPSEHCDRIKEMKQCLA